ncbi:MAG: hypothetical protein KC736_03940 [Candidatus Moranbacteria bacterium]|nr:hypothetical protein [Candidatus Moranbacteria bacterium]
MMNIKNELEENTLLRDDLGPFKEESDEWGSKSLVFSNTGARITAASSEQGIRGLRHREHRPDLIIGDDVENMASAKTKEGREKTYEWLKGEVIPAGDTDTDLAIVGNLLHEDSLLMHLKRDIEEKRLSGMFKSYPLLDENDEPLWKDKYPSKEEIQILEKTIGDNKTFRREFLLEIVPDDDQVLAPEDIHYYKNLPKESPRKVIIGIDLAISEKSSADCTAVVSALIYGHGKDAYTYILPHPINKRMRDILKHSKKFKHNIMC